MNSKAIIAVALVAILVVAGVAAVVIVNNGKESSSADNSIGCKLRVLGTCFRHPSCNFLRIFSCTGFGVVFS